MRSQHIILGLAQYWLFPYRRLAKHCHVLYTAIYKLAPHSIIFIIKKKIHGFYVFFFSRDFIAWCLQKQQALLELFFYYTYIQNSVLLYLHYSVKWMCMWVCVWVCGGKERWRRLRKNNRHDIQCSATPTHPQHACKYIL